MRGAYGSVRTASTLTACVFEGTITLVLTHLPDDGPGKRVLLAREVRGLTQRMAARRLRCTPQWLGAIERGERSLSAKWGMKLAVLYETTMDWIFMEKGNAPCRRTD